MGFIKQKIGEFSRTYGAKVKKAKLILKLEIENELKTLHANLSEANKEQYKLLQSKLNEIIENEVKGSILRSLCKDFEDGEKCSKYFFLLKNTEESKKP